MQYDDFVGRVQNQARLASGGEAVRAIRATLEALDRRVDPGAAEHLSAQLPREIGSYLGESKRAESFDLNRFFNLVAEKEDVDFPDAVHHARVVLSVVQEAVTPGEMAHVRAQLPDEWEALFEAGSEGELDVS